MEGQKFVGYTAVVKDLEEIQDGYVNNWCINTDEEKGSRRVEVGEFESQTKSIEDFVDL